VAEQQLRYGPPGAHPAAAGGPWRLRCDAVLTISEASEVDADLVAAVARLLPQLSRSAPAPTAEDLGAVVASPATRLLIASDEGRIVGTLTLALFRIPSGVRAWIEDVITDADARGRGVGEALTRRALDLAAEHGARTVELTSRPSREAANRLYQRLGFEIRETNVYRFELGDAR
jgi:ribosomal protein S18 acetylase RimI-like enzyme